MGIKTGTEGGGAFRRRRPAPAPAQPQKPFRPVENSFPEKKGFRLGQYRVLEEKDDYLICVGYDPNAKDPLAEITPAAPRTIKVAKPPALQRTPWDGTVVDLGGVEHTYEYSNDEHGVRTARWIGDDGVEQDEEQRIDPPYIVTTNEDSDDDGEADEVEHQIIVAVEIRKSAAVDGTDVRDVERDSEGNIIDEGGRLSWMDLNVSGRHWKRPADERELHGTRFELLDDLYECGATVWAPEGASDEMLPVTPAGSARAWVLNLDGSRLLLDPTQSPDHASNTVTIHLNPKSAGWRGVAFGTQGNHSANRGDLVVCKRMDDWDQELRNGVYVFDWQSTSPAGPFVAEDPIGCGNFILKGTAVPEGEMLLVTVCKAPNWDCGCDSKQQNGPNQPLIFQPGEGCGDCGGVRQIRLLAEPLEFAASDITGDEPVVVLWVGNRWLATRPYPGIGCGLEIDEDVGTIIVDVNQLAGCGLTVDEEEECHKLRLHPGIAGEGLRWDEDACSLNVDTGVIPCLLTICDRVDDLEDRMDDAETRLDDIEDEIQNILDDIRDLFECCRENQECCYYLDQRLDYCCGDGLPDAAECGRCVWEWNDPDEEPELVEGCSGGGTCACSAPPPGSFDGPGIYYTNCDGDPDAGGTEECDCTCVTSDVHTVVSCDGVDDTQEEDCEAGNTLIWEAAGDDLSYSFTATCNLDGSWTLQWSIVDVMMNSDTGTETGVCDESGGVSFTFDFSVGAIGCTGTVEITPA